MGSCGSRDGCADFKSSEKASSMEMVLLLSARRELSELHICKHSSAAPYGLGSLRTSIPFLEHLSDSELHWSSADLRFIILGNESWTDVPYSSCA